MKYAIDGHFECPCTWNREWAKERRIVLWCEEAIWSYEFDVERTWSNVTLVAIIPKHKNLKIYAIDGHLNALARETNNRGTKIFVYFDAKKIYEVMNFKY